MTTQQLYTIQSRLKDRENSKWISMAGFSHMRKSFADGAWAMLKAHYSGVLEYRLVADFIDPEVIDTWYSGTVKVN